MIRKFAPWFLVLTATLALAGCGGTGQSASGSNLVFVTNEFSGDLSIVNGSTGQVEGTYPLGKRPSGLSLIPRGRFPRG